ncbi:MAG TPA: asparagine synthetase A [Candidatus Heimdallarchaeota archaeon]|nr:asparagine synthetase A [Candidatus Heimdallarchaeota archaeon]
MRVFTDDQRVCVLTIKSEIMRSAGAYLRQQGFIEILPVILSPITDPLHHETYGGAIDYYGQPYQLTKSMILHKQISLRTVPRVFCFSPNVRLEPAERAALGRYLAEFVQLDLEVREATRDGIMEIGEGLFVAILQGVMENCVRELDALHRTLAIPKTPFEQITYQDAQQRFGRPFDDALSKSLSVPTWVIDFPREVREFYDREDPSRLGTLLDMDLVYPEGYGEALSGGEREYALSRIQRRIEQDKLDPQRFRQYLDVVEDGIVPSAGFGIGIERLTRYVCGLDSVGDARLFAKLPGVVGSI